jgi:hypothetical protein
MTVTRRPYPGDDTFCTGFDVPDREAWGPAEVAFWTSTPSYQPWKDVAAFFRQHEMPVCEACGEPATRQDCEGVWLCEGDFQHLVEHWLIEEAANG